MGYYFEKARTLKDLNEEQRARYTELRSTGKDELHPELLRRYNEIRAYIGPVSGGETWAALEELVTDTFVTWVLADEDSTKVQWSNPPDLI